MIMLYRGILFSGLLLLALRPCDLISQDDIGNWLMYFGTNKVAEKISIHTELQYRNHTVAPVNPEQLLWRLGLNYHFSPAGMITGGYAYVPSYERDSELGDPDTREHRIWQQLILTQTIGKVKFEHRYRTEQRWVEQKYRGRLRYRFMAFLPLNRPKIEPGAFFLAAYDEIFINTKRSFFDRNRLYGALGYQVSTQTGIQMGLLRQRLEGFGKTYLQFAVIFNPDLTKKIVD